MNFFKKLLGGKTSVGGDAIRAQIQMGIRHGDHQRGAVVEAFQEFIDSHQQNISSKPNMTVTSDGSVLTVPIVARDAAEATQLNDDLKRRLIARGISWD